MAKTKSGKKGECGRTPRVGKSGDRKPARQGRRRRWIKMETIINKQDYRNTMKGGTLAFLIISLVLFSMTLIQASDYQNPVLPPVIQGEDLLLYQTCNNCTTCNFTRLSSPDDRTLLSNMEATKDGTYYSFNVLGGNTTELGTYTYCYSCGNSAESRVGCIDVPVTPSGRNGSSNIAFTILLIIIIYAITFISFFGRNMILSILTGMIMTTFGVWIIRNGIVIYRDNLTNYFGYVTIAIGALIALWSLLAWIEDL